MKTVKLIYYKMMESLLPLIGKDPMKYKILKYRLHGAKIGNNVRAFSPISSAESYLITVGNDVTVATGVRFITHDNSAIKIYNDATDIIGPIHIGNNVFIGANSTILPGVSIADNCIIGAGSVVCRSCEESGMVVAGNPARQIGTIEKMKEKYEAYRFDFRNTDKRNEIMKHPEKWIKK